MIETLVAAAAAGGGGVLSPPARSAEGGFVCQAGKHHRFLAHVEAEFPVYFQRCVFILGDWGDCVSLKAPSSASTHV